MLQLAEENRPLCAGPSEQQQQQHSGAVAGVGAARPGGGRSKAEALRQWISFVNWLYRRYQATYGRPPTSTEAAHLMARYLPRYWKSYQEERYQSMRG